MRTEEERLQVLRASMSPSQREEMSEIVRREMERRGLYEEERGPLSAKPSRPKRGNGLGTDELREIYADANRRESERKALLRGRKHLLGWTGTFPVPREKVLKFGALALVAVLCIAKIFSGGGEDTSPALISGSEFPAAGAATENNEKRASLKIDLPDKSTSTARENPARLAPETPQGVSQRLITDLDSRRIELEKRREVLDRREEQIRTQEEALNERLAELRALTEQLGETRAGEDEKKTARLDQLATVYGAMNPNEAADLMSRLEPAIALSLLERMPEKRMGQILGLMDHDRAIELTRELSN
jgi:flagellar motility protein MotE (MotC chaperone)